MFNAARTYLLAALMVLTSLTLAGARGGHPDIGMEVVICSGVTMTTITIGADGQPIEESVVCPDGTLIFAADFTLPDVILPEARLLEYLPPARPVMFTTRNEIFPAARGPPEPV